MDLHQQGRTSGVGAGSVALLIVYKRHWRGHTTRRLFTDDLQIYASCSPQDLAGCITKLNKDIRSIGSWAKRNRLCLNLAKTKAIMLGNNRNINQIDITSLPALGDGVTAIAFEPMVRNLGIIQDSKLRFYSHVANVTSSTNRALYRLQQLRDFTDWEMRKRLVAALVLPIVNYYSVILLCAGTVIDCKLQRLVNKGIRFIFNLPRDASISGYRRKLG